MKKSNWKTRALALTMAASAALGMVAAPVSAGWYETNGNWRYTNENGTQIRNRFEQIDGKWYMFDGSGNMMTGWYKMPNSQNWYYLREDGSAVVNQWFYDPGKGWYYMGPDGKMDVGWLKLNGTWYYLMEDGRMCSSWRQITSSGRTDWYYFNDNGSMKSNSWLSYKGSWYYFDDKGRMLKDCTTNIDKVDYTFDKQGRMVEQSASLDIYNAIEKALLAAHPGATDAVANPTQVTLDMLPDAYGISKENVASCYGEMASFITNCDLLLVAEAADGKLNALKEQMEKALEKQKAQFEWYGVMGNTERCAAAKVVTEGNYVALIMVGINDDDGYDCAGDVAIAEKAFRAAAK